MFSQPMPLMFFSTYSRFTIPQSNSRTCARTHIQKSGEKKITLLEHYLLRDSFIPEYKKANLTFGFILLDLPVLFPIPNVFRNLWRSHFRKSFGGFIHMLASIKTASPPTFKASPWHLSTKKKHSLRFIDNGSLPFGSLLTWIYIGEIYIFRESAFDIVRF